MILSEAVARIRAIKTRTGKQLALSDALKNDEIHTNGLLGQVVKFAMDPGMTFNVGVLSIDRSKIGAQGSEVLTQQDFSQLQLLANRKLNRTEGAAWVNFRIQSLQESEADLLIKILDKDLDWGLGASSVHSIAPGLLTEFCCMLAAKFSADAIKYPCAIEPKYDGMRVLAFYSAESGVQFFSRTGKEVNSMPAMLASEVEAIAKRMGFADGLVFDGEVMGDSFKETMEKARRKSETFEDAKFYIFDFIPRVDFNKVSRVAYALPYMERRKALDSALKHVDRKHVVLPESYIASSEEEVTHYYNSFRDLGLEGLIIKARNGPYVGKRSNFWIKMKAEETEDLEIVGYEEGDGKFTNNLGAIIVDRSGVQIRVGSGLSDADRTLIWNNQTLYLGKFIEVQFQEVTPDGSLRHPRFVRLRMDKSEW